MAEAWNDLEVAATVADYFEMLRAEVDGRPFNKAAHRAQLRGRLTNRSDGAIEFKHQNISAVLQQRGLRWIQGYIPRANYQLSLADDVDRRLAADPAFAEALRPVEAVGEALVGNKAIEDAAIRWVMELERRAGRNPLDRRYVAAFPGDLDSPPRAIEVKAFGRTNRGFGLWLEVPQVEAAKADPNFFLYVVENVRQGDPTKFTLKVLGGKPLANLLARARERRYYEVPWPVGDYDSAPGLDD